jgi:hypothetical protein
VAIGHLALPAMDSVMAFVFPKKLILFASLQDVTLLSDLVPWCLFAKQYCVKVVVVKKQHLISWFFIAPFHIC